MTIHGELTAKDWLAARWEFLRAELWDSLWETILLLILLAIFLYFHVPLVFVLMSLVPFIPRVFMLAEYPYLIRMSPSALQKVLLRFNALPGPRDIEINPEGIGLSGPSITKRINWNESYRKFEMGRDYLLVFESFNQYQIFPRRWFTSEQLAKFEEYLKYGLTQRSWIRRFWPSS